MILKVSLIDKKAIQFNGLMIFLISSADFSIIMNNEIGWKLLSYNSGLAGSELE